MKIVQMGRLDFFWSFFIYNLSNLELQNKSYEFLKFKLYSGISYIRIIPENQLLRQPDVSGQLNRSGSNLTVGPACQGDYFN